MLDQQQQHQHHSTFYRVHGSATAVNCVVIAEPDRCLSVSSAVNQDGDGEGVTLVLSDPSNATIVHRWNVGVHHGCKEVTKVACCVQADVYATASRDKTVNIWARNGNASTAPVGRCVGHELVVTGVATDGAGTKLFSGSRDNTVRLWNVDTGVCVRKTALAQNLVTHVRWGCGDRVAQSSEDKMIHVWDVRNMEAVISTAPKHHIQTWCDVDEPYILASSNGFSGSGCEATLWDVRAANRPVREFRGHFETVSACCFVRGHQQRAGAPGSARCNLFQGRHRATVEP
jgi:WD40 repeat protein